MFDDREAHETRESSVIHGDSESYASKATCRDLKYKTTCNHHGRAIQS